MNTFLAYKHRQLGLKGGNWKPGLLVLVLVLEVSGCLRASVSSSEEAEELVVAQGLNLGAFRCQRLW